MIQNTEYALEHQTRKMIYNHIINYPGVSYLILKEIFNLSDGTLRYHLRYLVKAERIISKLESGKRFYYPNKTEITNLIFFEPLKKMIKFNLHQKIIIETIKQNPGINQKDLIKRTNLKRFRIEADH